MIGLSAFGMRDCIAETDVICRERQFHLAQALLPNSFLEEIRTGKRAEQDRTHTGLHWPLEAQITTGEPLPPAVPPNLLCVASAG